MRWTTIIAVGALSACAGIATAGISVLDENGAPIPSTSWTMTSNPDGSLVMVLHELHSPWQETWFVIRADAGERFKEVRIEVDGPPAGSPLLVSLGGSDLRSVEAILQTGTAETRLDRVEVVEDIGAIEVQSIGDVIAARDVLGPVLSTTTINPVRGIDLVQAGRSVLGPVLAEQGRIGRIEAGASIGTSLQPVVIRSRFGLGSLACEADAVLDLDLRTGNATGTIWRLEAATLLGSLAIDGFAVPAGETGEPYLHLSDGGLHADLHIGCGLDGTTPILRLPLAGLHGQVIVNGDDAGATWTSPVRLGEPGENGMIDLTGPAYASTPASLGGGAVGLVPFRMHMSGCEPMTGTLVPAAGSTTGITATLRWYGPVTWPGGIPLQAERRDLDTNEGWTPVPDWHFLFLPGTDATTIRIESAADGVGFLPGGEYRFRPGEHLRCDLATLPPVAAGDAWTIAVDDANPTCHGDIDGNGAVGVTDLLVLIACWGEVDDDLAEQADLDGDGWVGIHDLLGVIASWGDCE